MEWAWWVGVALAVLGAVAGLRYGGGFFRGHPTWGALFMVVILSGLTVANLLSDRFELALWTGVCALVILVAWVYQRQTTSHR